MVPALRKSIKAGTTVAHRVTGVSCMGPITHAAQARRAVALDFAGSPPKIGQMTCLNRLGDLDARDPLAGLADLYSMSRPLARLLLLALAAVFPLRDALATWVDDTRSGRDFHQAAKSMKRPRTAPSKATCAGTLVIRSLSRSGPSEPRRRACAARLPVPRSLAAERPDRLSRTSAVSHPLRC
jgi:hypothetical protein